MIRRKAAECKLFWIENEKGLRGVVIFLAKNWVDKVIDISRVSDMILRYCFVSVISVYTKKYGLDGSQKDDFYDSLNNVASKLGGREL